MKLPDLQHIRSRIQSIKQLATEKIARARSKNTSDSPTPHDSPQQSESANRTGRARQTSLAIRTRRAGRTTRIVAGRGVLALRRNFLEHTAWAVSAVTGTVGIILLFILLISRAIAADGSPFDPPREQEDKSPPSQSESRETPDTQAAAPDPFNAIDSDDAVRIADNDPPTTPPEQTDEPEPDFNEFFLPDEEPEPFDEHPVEQTPFDEADPFSESEMSPLDEPLDDDSLNLEIEISRETPVEVPIDPDDEIEEVLSKTSTRLEPDDEQSDPLFLTPGPLDDTDPWELSDSNRAGTFREPEAYQQSDIEPNGEDELVDTADEPLPMAPQETDSKRVNVTIESTAPAELPLQKTTSYELIVRNESDTAIDRVIVEEHVAATHRVVDVSPPAELENQTLRWQLKHLEPGETRTLTVQVFPTADGLAESTAAVKPSLELSTRTLIEAPKLKLEMIGPEQVQVGQRSPIRFTITNTGSLPTDDILLHVDVPSEFSYHAGRELMYEVGTLEPGESHTARLTLIAEKTGSASCTAELLVGDGLREQDSAEIEIAEPPQILTPQSRRPATSSHPTCRIIIPRPAGRVIILY